MKKAGIYVHIPFCRSKCDYCAFVSTPMLDLQEKYLDRLLSEIAHFDGGQKIDTLYFGGGTPSVARRGFLTQVYNALSKKFDLSDLEEFTVECNPESVSFGFLCECKHLNVNRLSMGLQSADDTVLEEIGRVHTVDQYKQAVKRAQSFGIDNVSGDLILGLPNQNMEDVVKAVKIFAELNLNHVSVYSLSVEEGTPLCSSGYSVSDDLQADMYDLAVSELKEYGFDRYETSNFARNGMRSKHNGKYWTGEDYYGFGVAAHSLIGDIRKENTDSISEYIRGITVKNKYKLTKEDRKKEFIMLRLRTTDGLPLNEYKEKFSEDLLQVRAQNVEKLLNAELIEVNGDILKTSEKGAYLLNSIITELI